MTGMLTGIYVPGRSVIHRLDARAKLIGFLALVIATLSTDSWLGYLTMFAAISVLIILSQLKLSQVFGSLGRMTGFFAIIFLMNLLFFSPEDSWFSWWIITPSYAGLFQATNVVFRVSIVMVLSNILNSCTAPLDLTRAMEALLRPLSFIGIPTGQIAMIVSVAIQFIPTLLAEADQIRKAQVARGAKFDSPKLIEKAAAIRPLVLPIFLSAFKRADELAMAMEARGYQPNKKRTLKYSANFSGLDVFAVIVCVLICLSQLTMM